MNNEIFIYQELINPSFLQRIFRQYPEENVVIEINNTLATTPILEITDETIKAITEQVPVDVFNQYRLNFVEFYAVYLNKCLENFKITNFQAKELSHLQNLFRLDTELVKKIHSDIVGKFYRNEYDEAIKNKNLSSDDKFRLEEIRINVRLTKVESLEIEKEAKKTVLQPYFKELLNLETLPQVKEEELNAILKNLEFTISSDLDLEIKKLKKYWTWKFGQVNKIVVSYNLQKDEFCYLEISSKWYEFLARSNYDTIARYNLFTEIPITKSGLQNRNVSDLKLADYGTLYLTNKRIIFVGFKNHIIKFDQIQSIGIYSNGVELKKYTGRDVFVEISEDSQKFAVFVNRILKN